MCSSHGAVVFSCGLSIIREKFCFLSTNKRLRNPAVSGQPTAIDAIIIEIIFVSTGWSTSLIKYLIFESVRELQCSTTCSRCPPNLSNSEVGVSNITVLLKEYSLLVDKDGTPKEETIRPVSF